MEFHIMTTATDDQLQSFRNDILAQDPAAMVDRDGLGRFLRASTHLVSSELLTIAEQAGLPLDRSQVQPQPSVCCGGCGG